MSEDSVAESPVELTRRAVASGNGGDYEAMMAFFGPESSLDMTGVGLGRYSGLPAIRRFIESWIGSLQRIEFWPEEVHELGNGVVFALIGQNAQPIGTKGFLSLRYAAVYLWVEGMSVQVSHYRDVEEARSAAEALTESRG